LPRRERLAKRANHFVVFVDKHHARRFAEHERHGAVGAAPALLSQQGEVHAPEVRPLTCPSSRIALEKKCSAASEVTVRSTSRALLFDMPHGDNFGHSVSLSSDGSRLAVAASGEASNATGIGGDQTNNSAAAAGAVYTYVFGP
jgi:hypothetical protein